MNRSIYFSKIIYTIRRVGSNCKFRLLLDLNTQQIEYRMETLNEVMSLYEKKLSSGSINQILPLCAISSFEQYLLNNPNMVDSWGDSKNSIGYRDGTYIIFHGIIDSDVPELKIEMTTLYDRQHEPPQEKLYRFLIHNFLSVEKDLKKYIFK